MTERDVAELMHAPLGDKLEATASIEELEVIVRFDLLVELMAEANVYTPAPGRPRSGPVETGLGR